MSTADSRHVRVFLGIEIRTDREIKGAIIPGSSEKTLPLSGKLLEEYIGYRGIIWLPRPRATQLFGDILRGHCVEYVCIVQLASVPDVYANLAQPWSHAYRLDNVQHLFGIVRVPNWLRGGAVQQYVVDSDTVGLPGIAETRIHIAEVVASKLQQPDCLAVAVECRAAVVCCPHIAAEVRTTRARACHIWDLLFILRSRQHGTRYGVIVETGNMRHRHAQIERGLAIRRKNVRSSVGC